MNKKGPQLTDQPFSWRRVRPLVVITAELSSVFVLVASVLSVTMNFFMFDRWDINFLSVANPSDILMSGVEILRRAVAWILILLAPAVGGAVGIRFVQRYFPRVLIDILALSFVSAWAFVFFFCKWIVKDSSELYPTHTFQFQAVAVAALWAFLLAEIRNPRDGIYKAIYISVVSTITILAFVSGLYVGRASRYDLYVRLDQPLVGCYDPRVRWIGVSTIVAQCDIKDSQGYRAGQYFVVDRQKVVLMSATTRNYNNVAESEKTNENNAQTH